MNALTDRNDLGFHEFVVLPKAKVKGLLAAAERVQAADDDGADEGGHQAITAWMKTRAASALIALP